LPIGNRPSAIEIVAMTLVVDQDTQSETRQDEVSHDDGFDGGNFDDDGHGGGDDDGDGGDDAAPSGASLSADVLGMLVFIASEMVLFLALIFTFVWARSRYPEWPPAGQPRLPLEVTSVNTLVLLTSGYTMYRAWHAIREGGYALHQWLFLTSLLGVVFLTVQGFEWVRLIRFGLTVSGNLYGATFYTLIGAHALHVFIAVQVLLVVWHRARRGLYSPAHHTGVVMSGLFWGFVVLIWPILFVMVYLS
jgi:heme/copper-type cytochrome/quinol oxidase subunit 3